MAAFWSLVISLITWLQYTSNLNFLSWYLGLLRFVPRHLTSVFRSVIVDYRHGTNIFLNAQYTSKSDFKFRLFNLALLVSVHELPVNSVDQKVPFIVFRVRFRDSLEHFGKTKTSLLLRRILLLEGGLLSLVEVTPEAFPDKLRKGRVCLLDNISCWRLIGVSFTRHAPAALFLVYVPPEIVSVHLQRGLAHHLFVVG